MNKKIDIIWPLAFGIITELALPCSELFPPSLNNRSGQVQIWPDLYLQDVLDRYPWADVIPWYHSKYLLVLSLGLCFRLLEQPSLITWLFWLMPLWLVYYHIGVPMPNSMGNSPFGNWQFVACGMGMQIDPPYLNTMCALFPLLFIIIL